MEASRVALPSAPTPVRRAASPKRAAAPALEELYRTHAREVYQYALALLANPADAEDVTQTTFLNAYRALQRGERPHRPHNWLIAIAHNVCRMRWRQASSRPNEVALEEAPEPVAPIHEKPDLDQVLQALAKLSFNQRAALVMRELEGRSYQEISDVLGVSVSAVEALLFRARQQLRVHRRDLGILTTVPLPGSLSSFSSLFGAGGGGVAAGGAAAGADLVLKAAAVVAAGALTAGVGYQSVRAVAQPNRPTTPQASALAARTPPGAPAATKARPAQPPRRARPSARRPTLNPATSPAQPAQGAGNTPSSAAAPATASAPAAPVAAATSAPTTAVSNTASTASGAVQNLVTPVNQVVEPVAQLVAPVVAPVTQLLPPLPSLVPPTVTVQTPALPLVPPVTATVTTPTVPIPPLGK
jgi:RNA polymerase sigma factor (sigma-70 family)